MSTITWTGSGDGVSWDDGNNWDSSAPPATGDDVIFASGSIDGGGSPNTLGSLTMSGSAHLRMALTVTGTVTLGDTSYVYGNDIHAGQFVFNDASHAEGILLYGPATFNASAYVNSAVTITGDVTVNGANDFPGNVTGNMTLNDTATVSGAVTGTLTCNDATHLTVYGSVVGLATFNDTSSNEGTIVGDAVFNDTSSNAHNITGNVTFHGTGNNGAITGNAIFYGTGSNGSSGTVSDTGYVRQPVSNFLTWRSYANSAQVGTLVLQFPELDVLGTGLF